MAMAKKEKKEPSCPMWMATYGDLVTNMLVFFVLLLSMSEIKKEDKFLEFMQAVQEAFGYVGGTHHLPVEETLDVKNVPLQQMLVVPAQPENLSPTQDRGPIGKHDRVTRSRPVERYEEGGQFNFGVLSTELDEQAQLGIASYAEQVRGLRTQIEVRGHCSRRPVDDLGFHDYYEFSFARAKAVADELIRQGVDPARIVVVAAATNEPVSRRNYTDSARAGNDIVEVLQINKRVEEHGAE